MYTMNFFLKFFFFFWILYHFRTESAIPRITFNSMALGHSGLLIFWEIEKHSEPINYTIFIKSISTGEENQNSRKIEEGMHVIEDQYMITSLVENTEYTITIKFRKTMTRREENQFLNATYILKGKTALITNSEPAKPDMIIRMNRNHSVSVFHTLEIIWMPCGKERVCHGKTSGTHFLIKFRCIESKKITIIHPKTDRQSIKLILFPGKIYEVVVTSINGDFQTDSDPEEIYVTPCSSSVRYVKLLPLNESSIMISWKAPKELYFCSNSHSDIQVFSTYLCLRPKDGIDNTEVGINLGYPSGCIREVYRKPIDFNNHAVVISNLEAAAEYIFIIIPGLNSCGSWALGTEYAINHKHIPHNYDDNLPIATPDMNWEVLLFLENECFILLEWLPCGKSFDCHNTRPGYTFIMEYKLVEESIYTPLNESEYSGQQEKLSHPGQLIEAEPNQVYDVKCTSVRGSNYSTPIMKRIETLSCQRRTN